jgi:hypothetical protein
MPKLSLLIALAALAVACVALLAGPRGREAARPAADASDAARDEQVRLLMAEARDRLDHAVAGVLKDVDWRLAKIDEVRRSMDHGLTSAQRAAADAARANYGTIESLRADVKRLAAELRGLEALGGRLDALEARLKAVEDRPPQIVHEVVHEKPPAPGPAAGPKPPTLPAAPTPSPAERAQEVAKVRRDLESEEPAVLFGAIDKAREYRVTSAVPRLLELLAKHPLDLIRGNAAAALGQMRVADAVPALCEALIDKSDLVAQQANKAVRLITGFDPQLAPNAGMRGRRAARGRVKEWWRVHEPQVRRDLGQPADGG